jgi:hypothetical protein
MVPAIVATMATTAAASGAGPTIATPGTHWVITTPNLGCENVHFEGGHKFVADELHDKGSWAEPTHSTLTMNWKGGANTGASLKATFKGASGRYKGTIHFATSTTTATISPGTKSGC